MPVEIKTIGASGQISLGKKYAGRIVTVDQIGEGVWTIKTARVIPDNELWPQTPPARVGLDRALEWDAIHTPTESNLDDFVERIAAVDKS